MTTENTTNLSLVKPQSEDNTVDWFDTMNDNMDLIDAAVLALRISRMIISDIQAADTDGIHGAITGNGAIQNITTAITNPDDSRNATITGSTGASGDVVLTGLVRGTSDTETIALDGTNTVQGNKPFDTITNIKVPAELTSPRTVSIGWGDKLGITKEISAVGNVYKIKINAADVTATYVTSKVNATYSTIDFSTIGAYQDITIFYKGT